MKAEQCGRGKKHGEAVWRDKGKEVMGGAEEEGRAKLQCFS